MTKGAPAMAVMPPDLLRVFQGPRALFFREGFVLPELLAQGLRDLGLENRHDQVRRQRTDNGDDDHREEPSLYARLARLPRRKSCRARRALRRSA